MARVVASARLPAPVAELLGREVEYVEPEHELARDELLAAVATAEGLISLLTVAVDAELFDAAPKLKVVGNYAVGYDNIDLVEATRRGIVVCNTPDVLTEATADMTWALLLAVARRIVEGDALVRSGRWTGWFPDQHLGAAVHGQTIGIVGLGRIGQAVARRARGFDMEILYAGRRDVPEAGALGASRVELGELLARSHVVTLHCPQSSETRHLIDAAALRAMRKDAILLNTARGTIVDEAALATAVDTCEIAGAGLDVFEREPAVSSALVASPRVVLAPHAGSATTTTRRAMGELCARAVRAVLEGRRPTTVLNPEALP